MSCSRRQFINCAILGVCAAPSVALSSVGPSNEMTLHKAQYYKKLGEKKVQCTLCPRKCVVANLERGTCGVRENQNGEYYTLVHSLPCALNNDPIEKKPLFHFKPGTKSFSLATAGCNMECRFCQNWEISQFRPEQVPSKKVTPSEIVQLASLRGASSIAFTYSEPVIFYEYMRDICIEAQNTHLKRVMISNGYIQKDPLNALLPLLDAVKIDFKGFTESFYKKICSAELTPVLNSLINIVKKGVWLEIVVLLIPTLNDSEREIKALSKWIMRWLGKDVPVHFTRFHPMYKLTNLPPTPIGSLEKAYRIAKESGLSYVYLGNVPGHHLENTYCPKCNTEVIKRQGHLILQRKIVGGMCSQCKTPIAGKWD